VQHEIGLALWLPLPGAGHGRKEQGRLQALQAAAVL
jgi:hypothetical protein